MPRIILIRPAETDSQMDERLLGRHDADLNELGMLQAERLADALVGYPITYVGCSPLKRAMATAMVLADRNETSVVPVGGFQGADLGEWQDRSPQILMMNDRTRYTAWLDDPSFRAPGGESKRDVYARCFPAMLDIVQHTDPSETIAIVAQETVLQALCCVALDLEMESAHRFQIDHGAFAVFERLYPEGPYQLIAWNISHHLPKESALEELEELAY